MDLIQKKLECPFTWELEKQWARDFDEMNEPVIEFDEEPLLALISSIMITYFRAEKEDYQGALMNLKATDDIWEKLDENYLETIGVSTKVLMHVKIATEYYIYNLAKCIVEADYLLKRLKTSESFENFCEEATINGCKSVAWSSFHEKGHKKSTHFSRLASSQSPNCPLWHYILGKSLRLSRRETYGYFTPLDDEENAIMKSCELSNNPFYKIRLAQMYREKKDYVKSKEIYLEVFSVNPKSSSVLLRLAVGLMSVFHDLERAKKCIDEAGKYGQTYMYHHYLGIWYTKQKNFVKAIKHYKKAMVIGHNYKAELQCANAQQKISNNFNFIKHLESMLTKYSKNIKHKQQIFLHIGMRYYKNSKDIEKSLNYFLQGIEVDPENQQLKKFLNTTIDWKVYNIYDLVSEILHNHYIESSNLKPRNLKKLENYCEQYRGAHSSKGCKTHS